MKLIRSPKPNAAARSFAFQMTQREKDMLLATLKLFPLLDRRLTQLFADDRAFFKEADGDFQFTLTGEQLEWLLRVLNEVRVGSWVRLGRPELAAARKIRLTGAYGRLYTAMELCGYFQANLLEAFG
jgi:hypothetical protein